MIKGIVALFSSGILTNPMVLLGVIMGSFFYALCDAAKIMQIYKSLSFYGLIAIISVVYIIGFRRVYKADGETDWMETILAIFAGMLKLVIASVLVMSFIYMFDMGTSEELNGNINLGSESF